MKSQSKKAPPADSGYQVEKLLRDFAMVTSRQLARILSATLGELKYAQTTNDPAASKKAIEMGLRAGEHALGLARDLRFLATETTPDAETVDVSQLLLDTTELVEAEIAARNIDFNVSVEASTFVSVDRVSLRQSILNILYYGIDTTPKGGSLSLRLSRSLQSLEIVVSVSHPPKDEEQQQDIFNPLKAEHLMDVRALGLTVAKALIDAMGGEVSVTTLLGNETSFSVTLPVGKPALIPHFQHKRKYRRIQVELNARIKFGDREAIDTRVLVLGGGGCYITVDAKLEVAKGDPCAIQINHFGDQWINVNECHVTNVSHHGDLNGLGISFGNLSEHASNIILAIVRGHTD